MTNAQRIVHEIERKHLRRCGATGKRIFRTQQGARLHLTGMRAYRCEFCGWWHLTSQELMD